MQRNLTLALVAAGIGLGVVAFLEGGWTRVLSGLGGTAALVGETAVLITAAFVLSGLIQVLVSREAVSRWLGEGSGWRGLLIGGLAGALIPGGPYAYYPIAVAFLRSGANIGTIITFVVAKNLWTVSRLPLEVALLGVHVTWVRYVVTLVFPPLAGLLAQALFPGASRWVRDGLPEASP
ncbi:MAG TPA: permease [Trueperaceae bacterium]|nr:permease [Trueperaceae bacterium]